MFMISGCSTADEGHSHHMEPLNPSPAEMSVEVDPAGHYSPHTRTTHCSEGEDGHRKPTAVDTREYSVKVKLSELACSLGENMSAMVPPTCYA